MSISLLAIAVTSAGTVVVTGYSDLEGLGNISDVVTIAYSSAGVPLWTNIYNGPANGEDKATAIAVGTTDTIYVTGFATVSYNNADYLTIAYNTEGVALWTNLYARSSSSSDKAAAVVGAVVFAYPTSFPSTRSTWASFRAGMPSSSVMLSSGCSG